MDTVACSTAQHSIRFTNPEILKGSSIIVLACTIGNLYIWSTRIVGFWLLWIIVYCVFCSCVFNFILSRGSIRCSYAKMIPAVNPSYTTLLWVQACYLLIGIAHRWYTMYLLWLYALNLRSDGWHVRQRVSYGGIDLRIFLASSNNGYCAAL